jgi:hypothetical protein
MPPKGIRHAADSPPHFGPSALPYRRCHRHHGRGLGTRRRSGTGSTAACSRPPLLPPPHCAPRPPGFPARRRPTAGRVPMLRPGRPSRGGRGQFDRMALANVRRQNPIARNDEPPKRSQLPTCRERRLRRPISARVWSMDARAQADFRGVIRDEGNSSDATPPKPDQAY